MIEKTQDVKQRAFAAAGWPDDGVDGAALELERTIVPPPRVANAAYLDALGDAARKLELALGSIDRSPFAVAMQSAVGPVEELAADVEAGYKLDLD